MDDPRSYGPSFAIPDGLQDVDINFDARTLDVSVTAWGDGEPVVRIVDGDADVTTIVEFGLGRSGMNAAITNAVKAGWAFLDYAERLRTIQQAGEADPGPAA